MDKLIEILRFSISDEAAIIGSLGVIGGTLLIGISIRFYLRWAWRYIFNPLRRR